ncbi:MAG TPA: hypothetical protein PLY09_02555 [Methanothrix sp.]|nr:hypothetical protein [Methanothrix sp.]HPJ83623.1 hypothetical protein [Methanothrix sp.]
MIVKAPRNLRKLALIGPPGTGVLEIIKVPQLNSDGGDSVIEIRPSQAGDGLQMDAARDEYTPTYDDIYESVFGRPMPHSVRVQLNTDEGDDSDKSDVPSYEHIRKAVLGR